jgi:hypothetical protein
MWGSPSEEVFFGDLLQKLNSGKSLGAILMECSSWRQRAKILLNIKKIKKAYADFQQEVAHATG